MPMTERDLSRARPPCQLPSNRQMTKSQIPHRDFYVYALFRADGVTPFYIGKGRQYRINIHERTAKRETTHKDRIIQGMQARGETIPKAKLIEGLTDAQAKQIEIDLIQLIGRWPKGPLANLTKGGDGGDFSPDARAKRSAMNVLTWANPEVRAKRLAGIKAVWTDERRIEASRLAKLQMTPEAKERLQRSNNARRGNGKPKPPKKHQPTVVRELWKNPEWRAKVMEARKGKRKPVAPEQAAEMSARLNSPQALEKRRITNAIPEVNARRIAAQKAAFSTPEAKAKRSDVSKKMWAAKRAHQKVLPSANGIASKVP
jgi:hypothetical protein